MFISPNGILCQKIMYFSFYWLHKMTGFTFKRSYKAILLHVMITYRIIELFPLISPFRLLTKHIPYIQHQGWSTILVMSFLFNCKIIGPDWLKSELQIVMNSLYPNARIQGQNMVNGNKCNELYTHRRGGLIDADGCTCSLQAQPAINLNKTHLTKSNPYWNC